MTQGVHDIGLFVLAVLALAITPGPDMALILARSGRYGLKGGITATLGVGAGSFFHIIAAAVGISAMVLASATAFAVLKWAGAVYLVWMGVVMLFARTSGDALPRAMDLGTPLSFGQIFVQGALSNILNPKVAVFFLAFLPQFVDRHAPSTFQAFLMLGVLLNAICTLWNLILAWFAARLAATHTSGRGRLWLERAMGIFFIGIGVRLALVDRA